MGSEVCPEAPTVGRITICGCLDRTIAVLMDSKGEECQVGQGHLEYKVRREAGGRGQILGSLMAIVSVSAGPKGRSTRRRGPLFGPPGYLTNLNEAPPDLCC